MIINPYLVQPSGPSYGALTTAWIAATGETDLTILGALNTLESDLTTYGLTSKMKALYPFVGGTAGKHKFNFMDARDLDAAFRITWYGGVTHNSNGITGNGTNSYGDTYFNPSASLSISNQHISMYQRNEIAGSTNTSMGINQDLRFYLRFGSSNYSTLGMAQSPFAVQTPLNGMFVMSKISSNSFKYFQNSLTAVTKTGTDVNVNGKIALLNNGSLLTEYSIANLAFASIGDGLTDTEAGNLNTAVQAFQTTLSRQV
jgi:hypothetical protein